MLGCGGCIGRRIPVGPYEQMGLDRMVATACAM